ncbi:cytochrome c biogenesis protein CcmG [Candidatus Endolissoclinum faulkneri L5]|uniref:Cytochrome c biogenesis protein CcmG n=1 Tax=Candidatus Endolissoclinum faulkneri L5 TaxID=1401328 RepID=V9TTN2_9PROT|nr:DsbE family thiol:disulfide interchange protein [Candidatus Endolissoclinum faulkneri]AHC73527.1 cytochrome c biogenesis protein CcmG [Candidatus Endolissoclinum faulkneri L5]
MEEIADSVYRFLSIIPLLGAIILLFALVWPILEDHNPEELPSALLNKQVPVFDLPGLDPKAPRVRSANLIGKPAIVNFFASWCIPCRIEITELRTIASDGIIIYGLAYKDDTEAIRRFLSSFGNPYKMVGLDRDGRIGLEFGVYGLPETYIIDSKGFIRYRHVGALTNEMIKNILVPLLNKLGQ